MARCLFLMVVVFAANLFGQDSLDIVGPSLAEPGSLVRLEAELDQDESPFWLVMQPIDLDYEQVDAGDRIIFATGCEKTQVDIVVILLAQKVIDGRIITRQMRHTVKIGNQPDPVEPPDPIEPPENPFNPDDLSSKIDKAIGEMPAEFAADRIKLADNVSVIIEEWNADEFKRDSFRDSLVAMSVSYNTLNQNTVTPESYKAWGPVWKIVQTELTDKLIENESGFDLVTELESIEKGLRGD